MTFADHIHEILDSADPDNPCDIWQEMARTVDDLSLPELKMLSDRLWEVFGPVLPASVVFDPDAKHALIAALSSLFVGGVCVGREYARRGYL